jgi:hypothetical protein
METGAVYWGGGLNSKGCNLLYAEEYMSGKGVHSASGIIKLVEGGRSAVSTQCTSNQLQTQFSQATVWNTIHYNSTLPHVLLQWNTITFS